MAQNIQNYTQSYFASCAVGLEEVLSKELQAIGGKKVILERGGAEFKGDEITALRTVLYSRTASRIYKKLFSMPVDFEKNIYDFSRNIKWDKVFKIGQTFKIRALIGHGMQGLYPNSFKNSVYLSQTLKDGIVDYFRSFCDDRPDVDTENPDINLLLRVAPREKNTLPVIAAIFLDLCGNPLNQRGYRSVQTEAPVKENMAAGLIGLMDWNPEEDVFIDSMCGSGTFLIEAALIKADITPSFIKVRRILKNPEYKPWSFLNHNFFNENSALVEEFNNELNTCDQKNMEGFKKLRASEVGIFGFDINTDTTKACAENINTASMSEVIKIKQIDSTMLRFDSKHKGIIFCNPPYGERLGDIEKLQGLYTAYAENLKNNFKGFRAYILSGEPELRKSITLEPIKKIPIFNGPIECRLLKYELY